MTPTEISMDRKISASEWFSGIACLISAGTLVFSAGIVYGQTQDNTRRLGILEGKVDVALPDIASMKSDIKFLVRAEERRQGIKQHEPNP